MKQILVSSAVLSLLAFSVPLQAQSIEDEKEQRCVRLVVNPSATQQTNIHQSVDYDVNVLPVSFSCADIQETLISYQALTPNLTLTELPGPNPDLRVTPQPGALRLSRFLIQAEAYDINGDLLGQAQRAVNLTVLDGVDERADLITSSFTGPSTVIEGQSMTFRADFKNIGQQSSGNFFGQLTRNGINRGSRFCSSLAPQQLCTNRTWILTAPSPGSYEMKVCADSGQTVTEGNETNNCASILLEVLPTPKPDLVPEFVTCPPTPLRVGQPTQVTLGIRNQGNLISGAFNFEFEGIVGSCPALSPNQQCQQVVTWTPTVVGLQTITLAVDPADQVMESNESNNNLSKTVDVEPADGPDLYFPVDGVSISPAAPSVNSWIWVTVKMYNGGTITADSPRMDVLFNGTTRSSVCSDIPPGGFCQRTFNFYIGSAGAYTITAIADPFDQISEIHEFNNNRSLTFVVDPTTVTCAGTWFLSGVGHPHSTSSSGSVVDGCFVYFGQNTPSGCFTTTAPGNLSAVWYTDQVTHCPNYVSVTNNDTGEVFNYNISIQ